VAGTDILLDSLLQTSQFAYAPTAMDGINFHASATKHFCQSETHATVIQHDVSHKHHSNYKSPHDQINAGFKATTLPFNSK
jgi:hypothetical protein